MPPATVFYPLHTKVRGDNGKILPYHKQFFYNRPRRQRNVFYGLIAVFRLTVLIPHLTLEEMDSIYGPSGGQNLLQSKNKLIS